MWVELCLLQLVMTNLWRFGRLIRGVASRLCKPQYIIGLCSIAIIIFHSWCYLSEKTYSLYSSVREFHTFENVIWIRICCNVFYCRTSEKRVSAVVISNNDLYVSFADKFGVVWLVTLREDSAEQVSVDNKPVSILGHYCSIITSMVWTSSKFCITSGMDLYVLHLFSSECVIFWQTHKVYYTSVLFVSPFMSCITMLYRFLGIAEVFARWTVHCYCWQGLQNTSVSSVLCTDWRLSVDLKFGLILLLCCN